MPGLLRGRFFRHVSADNGEGAWDSRTVGPFRGVSERLNGSLDFGDIFEWRPCSQAFPSKHGKSLAEERQF